MFTEKVNESLCITTGASKCYVKVGSTVKDMVEDVLAATGSGPFNTVNH